MYKIDRLEIVKNKEGIDELFFSVQITDKELGVYSFARWIKPEEFEVYNKDNSKINEIIESYLPIAKQNKINEIEYLKNHPINLENYDE